MNYIISQIFVILSFAALYSTYFCKNQTRVLLVGLLANFLNCFAYFFLSAWAGSVMALFSIGRNLLFLSRGKIKKLKYAKLIDAILLAVVLAFAICVSIATFSGWPSLLPLVGTLLYTVGCWQSNNVAYKILGMSGSVLWVIYDVIVMSIFGIIFEGIAVVVPIVSLIKMRRENKKIEVKS